MKINTCIFTIFYLALLCFLPLLFVLFRTNNKINRKQYLNLKMFLWIWAFLFSIVAFSLTLLEVSLNKDYITFNLPTTENFFHFYHLEVISLHNFIINLALVIPLGVITFCNYKINSSYSLNPQKTLFTNISLSFFAGAGLGLTIELLQGILPCSRVSEISDILFNSTCTILSFYIVLIYYSLINFLSNTQHIKK